MFKKKKLETESTYKTDEGQFIDCSMAEWLMLWPLTNMTLSLISVRW